MEKINEAMCMDRELRSKWTEPSVNPKCDICDKHFEPAYLSIHKARMHKTDQGKRAAGLKCDACDSEFRDTQDLKNHEKICLEGQKNLKLRQKNAELNPKSGKRPDPLIDPKCDICEKTFVTGQGLNIHKAKMLRTDQDKRAAGVKCEVCDSEFTWEHARK